MSPSCKTWMIGSIAFLSFYLTSAFSQECADWKNAHPEWIFCDDFESVDPLVGPGRYFEVDDNNGDFVVADAVGLNESRGIRIRWQKGEVVAGSLKLAFGKNPQSYMDKGIRNKEDFREIYYRMYLKMQLGWKGNPHKLSRATIFNQSSDWTQAMIAHLWSDDNKVLLLDPARCVDVDNQVTCTKYNDFEKLEWLGNVRGITKIFSTENSGRWFCVEHHVQLNDPGESNGLQELWIDGNLETRALQKDFVRSWKEYGLNAVFFENHWNGGSTKDQERYFDNIVVSTQPVGCLEKEL